MSAPGRRFIPMPRDWARSRVFRELWKADPAHVGRFLWLVNQATQANRNGLIVLGDGQVITAEDCAAETDRDVGGWTRCVELLVEIEQLRVEEEGMRLLVWREWHLERRGPRRFIPMPLDWPRSRVFRQLRDAGAVHLCRLLWLINQAHLAGRAGEIVLGDGQPLTPEDCAAETDRDVAGWETSAALLSSLEQLQVDQGMHLSAWPLWYLPPGDEVRQEAVSEPPAFARVSEAPQRPPEAPSLAVVTEPRPRAKRSRVSNLSPEEKLIRTREQAAARQRALRERRNAGSNACNAPSVTLKGDVTQKVTLNDHVTQKVTHVTLNPHVTQKAPETVTLMAKCNAKSNACNATHVHVHGDQHEHEESCHHHVHDGVTRPEARPPLMSDDDDDRSLFDRKFWDLARDIVAPAFLRLTGQSLGRRACEFATSKLLELEPEAWRRHGPEARAYAIAWACDQVRARIAAGEPCSNPWPYALACAQDHLDLVDEQLRQNAFMVSRGRSARPLLYFDRTTRRKAVG